MLPATLNDRRRCVGFTLVELLLVVALLVLLSSAIVFNFSSLQQGAVLEEGANQLEALFRFARAQAALTGRQVQISFEEDLGDGVTVPLGRLRLRWEPDPVARPGVFEDLPEASAYIEGIVDRISIEDVHPWPVPASETRAGADGGDGFGFAPVIFYPDGSGDSVELMVTGRDAEEHRLLALSYSSITGTFRRRFLQREESGLWPDAEEEPGTTADAPEASPLPAQAP